VFGVAADDRVLDAGDGSERWHYTRRYDRYALATVLVTTDESTLVPGKRRPLPAARDGWPPPRSRAGG
jgi:hypothetical protein